MPEIPGTWFPWLEETFNPSTSERASLRVEGQSASLREKPARLLQVDTDSGGEHGKRQIPSAM